MKGVDDTASISVKEGKYWPWVISSEMKRRHLCGAHIQKMKFVTLFGLYRNSTKRVLTGLLQALIRVIKAKLEVRNGAHIV